MKASHRIVLSVLSPRLNDSNAYVPKAESISVRWNLPPHYCLKPILEAGRSTI